MIIFIYKLNAVVLSKFDSIRELQPEFRPSAKIDRVSCMKKFYYIPMRHSREFIYKLICNRRQPYSNDSIVREMPEIFQVLRVCVCMKKSSALIHNSK